MRSSSLLLISRMVSFSCLRLSHLVFTRRSRRFCFATEDLVAISKIPLLLAGWTLLPLFAVWVFFVDHVNTATAANHLIPFGRVGFNGSSYFHRTLTMFESSLLYSHEAFSINGKKVIGKKTEGQKKIYQTADAILLSAFFLRHALISPLAMSMSCCFCASSLHPEPST